MGCRTLVVARDTEASARKAYLSRGRSYVSRHQLDWTIAVTLTLVLFGASWYRHASFRSSTYDLAVFEQVVWKMANGRGATSTLTAWNAFADHLSPVLFVFVPLYRLVATPLWFFAAQALALGLAVLCVRPLATAVGLKVESSAATFLVAAFALHPAVWNAVLYDFHPTTLAVPVLLLGANAAVRRRHMHLALAVVALVVLRDDLALAGAAMAVLGWRADSRDGRIRRAVLVGGCLAWTVLGAQVGAAMGASRHFEARYGYLGESMTDAATRPLHSAVELVRHVVIGDNAFLVVALLLPFAFIALRRPMWCLAAAFVALPALAATDANFHSPEFHYGAPVVPFLVLAAAGGLHALGDVWDRRRLAIVVAPLVAMAFLMVGPAATRSLTRTTIDADDARAALATVKPGDNVVAGTALGPHLANRAALLPYPYPFTSVELTFPLDSRVTSTATTQQRAIDVVVASNVGRRADVLIGRIEATPEIAQHFTRTDFGTVTVFRRDK